MIDVQKKVSDMAYNELNDLIFYTTLRASKMANDSLFKGLSNFLYQYLDDFRKVLDELEYIKSVVRSDNKPKYDSATVDVKALKAALQDNQLNHED